MPYDPLRPTLFERLVPIGGQIKYRIRTKPEGYVFKVGLGEIGDIPEIRDKEEKLVMGHCLIVTAATVASLFAIHYWPQIQNSLEKILS